MKWYFWLLLSARGRIGRLPFIVCATAFAGYTYGFYALGHYLVASTAGMDAIQRAPDFMRIYQTIGFATLLPITYMTFSVCAKRLHDFNWSGLWQLLPLVLNAVVHQAPKYLPAPMDADMLQAAQHNLHVLAIQNDILLVAKLICFALLAMMCVRPGNYDGMRHGAGPDEGLSFLPKSEGASRARDAIPPLSPPPIRQGKPAGFGRRGAA